MRPVNDTRLIRMGCIKQRGCRMCVIIATETHCEKIEFNEKHLDSSVDVQKCNVAAVDGKTVTA